MMFRNILSTVLNFRLSYKTQDLNANDIAAINSLSPETKSIFFYGVSSLKNEVERNVFLNENEQINQFQANVFVRCTKIMKHLKTSSSTLSLIHFFSPRSNKK